LFVPVGSSQVVLRCEDVQIISQVIDEKFSDYQAVIPRERKTRTLVSTSELLNACKQAATIAREGTNVVQLHLIPAGEQPGKLRVLARSDEAGTSEIELPATVEGEELEIAFNVKYLLDALEVISTPSVALIRPVCAAEDKEDYFYVLMPMHVG
jgi:DNA polymerase III subunit beta